MDLTFTPEQDDFRQEVRTWLHENVPRDEPPYGDFAAMREFDTAWQRRQFEGGWAGIGWPKEYGGRGLSVIEQLVWFEEYARAGAPYIRTCFVGINHGGPTLILRGTEEQKRRHLPPILRGDEVWCQGFSEPDAGSDLASLRTRAVVDGDHLIVNGQKIWTSYAWAAQYQELLVRTDPDAPRHKGITWVICPMDLPGIEVRPIETMAGDVDFCEVFYTDVAIPLANIVGEMNQGWDVAMTTLSFERGTGFMAEQVALSEMIDELIELARARPAPGGGGSALDDEEFARRLATLRCEVTALRAMTYLGVSRNLRRGQPGVEGSFLRLSVGEVMQRICQLAMDILGVDGLRWTEPARHRGNWSNDYLYSFSRTISAGTKDIQRNIIGERLLGLPRA
ncbi:MAG TPA: acyl-CoA dehydrogenase family protein [Acidimicrobiales bacterium]|jgi:alkylation response protein AidB-like acyl-CoA dehydrogenase|nr:acyl-CoA dehydrogenase family protein [Acidimicrobiales bacterium]